jgi:hypothetical protein
VEQSVNVDPEKEIRESFSCLITSYWKHKPKTPTLKQIEQTSASQAADSKSRSQFIFGD